jgi:GTP-binding protein
VVKSDGKEFVLADIPGLIEGAHEGAGLGDRFLGHVERCGVLIHLVDGTSADVAEDWRTVRAELAAYSPLLAEKPELLVLNKCDALDAATIESKARKLKRAAGGGKVFRASGVSGKGVPELMRAAHAAIETHRRAEAEKAERERLAVETST